MKTKIWILTILAIVFAANAFATKQFKLRVIPLEGKKAIVDFWQDVPGKQDVKLLNEYNEQVYHWSSNNEQNRYVKLFNLKHLENGGYTVQIKSGENLASCNLRKTSDRIIVDPGKSQQLSEIDK